MAKRKQAPTAGELVRKIRESFSRWRTIKKKGTTDPFWPDGINLNLVRNHISYDREMLKELCKKERIRPCPREARLKLPRMVSPEYMAPRSRAAKHYAWPGRARKNKRG